MELATFRQTTAVMSPFLALALAILTTLAKALLSAPAAAPHTQQIC
jgi:hypothetical protein